MKDEDINAIIPGWTSYQVQYPKDVNVWGMYGTHPPPLPPSSKKWLILVFLLVLGVLIGASLLISACYARQTQPDAKRVHEIQTALVSHGYEAGRSWKETQNHLRDIARSHHWQVRYAPDARVLILLGLSNNDAEVIEEETNHLDGGTDEE